MYATKPEPAEPERWISVIVRQLRTAISNRRYGRLTIEIFDGRIVRAELVRSAKRPEDLDLVDVADESERSLG